MCFPSPGPRCSAHAHAEYLTALRRFERSEDTDEGLRLGLLLEEKRRVFDTTPRGTNNLRREVDATEDPTLRLVLQRRLDEGSATRKRQLQAYKTVKEQETGAVRSALRERGVAGRYQVAAGIAYNHLSERYPDQVVEIEDMATVRVHDADSEAKYLVLPQKYQGFWGEVTYTGGVWHGAQPDIETVLNAQGSGLERLDAGTQQLLERWFLAEVTRRGYSQVLAVDTRTEQTREADVADLFDLFRISLTLRQKRGGTTAWVGDTADLETLFAGTVFAPGIIVREERQYVVQGVPPQPKELLHVGEQVYLSWRDASEDFVVKRTHQSTKSSLIVKLGLLTDLV